MLNRSSYASELERLVRMRLLDSSDPMNQIASAISDQTDTGSSSTHIGYLPYFKHARTIASLRTGSAS